MTIHFLPRTCRAIGNDIGGVAYFQVPPDITNDAAFGPNAAGFYGGGWLTPPTNLVTTLLGSYSVSLWVKTTNLPSDDYGSGNSGGGLLTANADASEPMVLTGHKLAFETGGNPPNTLHSATRINSGLYTHLVVTRDQNTGQEDHLCEWRTGCFRLCQPRAVEFLQCAGIVRRGEYVFPERLRWQSGSHPRFIRVCSK